MEPPESVQVVDIVVERESAVTLTYADGVVAVFPVAVLRAACPCAGCRGWRDRGEVAWPRPGLSATSTLLDAQLTGAWGISIDWSDGHNTGIYAWGHLRRWWDSDLSAPLVDD